MIMILLDSSAGVELASIGRSGNEVYLCQDNPSFPILSTIDTCSFSVFADEDMPGLIQELERVQETLRDSQAVDHVREVVRPCRRCLSLPGSTVTFTI